MKYAFYFMTVVFMALIILEQLGVTNPNDSQKVENILGFWIVFGVACILSKLDSLKK